LQGSSEPPPPILRIIVVPLLDLHSVENPEQNEHGSDDVEDHHV
jgi:hypothetical protein